MPSTTGYRLRTFRVEIPVRCTRYEVDPDRIQPEGRLKDGIVQRFPGTYGRLLLSVMGNDLGSVDGRTARLHRLKVD